MKAANIGYSNLEEIAKKWDEKYPNAMKSWLVN